MDSQLDQNFVTNEKRKKIIKGILGFALIITIFYLIGQFLRPSLDVERIRTSTVHYGDMVATITGSGTVVPAYERVITSPFDTKLINVILKPGNVLKKGQKILDLDLTQINTEISQNAKLIEDKKTEKEKLIINYKKKSLSDESRIKIKKLNLDVLISTNVQQKKLFEIGGTSKEALNQAQLRENIARIELNDLEQSNVLDKENHQYSITTIDRDIESLNDVNDSLQQQLELGLAKSKTKGVLTWVVDEVGSTIRKGEVIAKTADLSSFKIEATISDVHIKRISLNQKVVVKDDANELSGYISNITPTIESGIIHFEIMLDNDSDPSLRSNLDVEVFIVTENKFNVLKVNRGPFVSGKGTHDVFVVRNNMAYKRKVQIGLSNFNYYGIISGIEKGEVVIISDMTKYMNVDQIEIK